MPHILKMDDAADSEKGVIKEKRWCPGN